jgi:hypothetical protein
VWPVQPPLALVPNLEHAVIVRVVNPEAAPKIVLPISLVLVAVLIYHGTLAVLFVPAPLALVLLPIRPEDLVTLSVLIRLCNFIYRGVEGGRVGRGRKGMRRQAKACGGIFDEGGERLV